MLSIILQVVGAVTLVISIPFGIFLYLQFRNMDRHNRDRKKYFAPGKAALKEIKKEVEWYHNEQLLMN